MTTTAIASAASPNVAQTNRADAAPKPKATPDTEAVKKAAEEAAESRAQEAAERGGVDVYA